ncbi:MAG: DUF481 domain-containing protein [Spirochaetes bacterium]|nr:DUF481 domain-containing protein [Spirochaetota bacterium]
MAESTAAHMRGQATQSGDGIAGKIGFGYALTTPTYASGIFQFSEVGYELGNQRLMGTSELSGVFENGNIRRPNGVLNAGYDYNAGLLRLFIYTNYEFGVITGLDSNTIVGAGARYMFLKFDRFTFDAGIAPIYDRAAYADNTLNETFSLSFRGRLKIFFSDFDSLYLTWLYLHSLDEKNNEWHAADVVNNTVLTRKISLRQGYRWRYDTFSGAAAGLLYLIAVFNFE